MSSNRSDAVPASHRRDAVRNREAIVSAAMEALENDPDVSMEYIAAQAGISRRAVYRHFGTKDSLVEGVIEALMDRGVRSLIGTLALDRGVDVQMAAGAARLWDGLGPARRLVSYRLNGAVRAFAFRQAAPLRTLLLDLIRRGQAEGTVRSDLTAEAVQYLVETHSAGLLEVATESPLDAGGTRSLFILSMLADIGLSAPAAQALIKENQDVLRR